MTVQDEQKFRDEARTIARLVYPHIVRVLEFGIEGKTPYLVMDYAPNGTLRDRHTSGTLVPLSIVVTYVKQVADALQYAHNAKLIHRDVKPENLLIGHRNEILLSDFGIAVVAHSTRSQVLEDKIGTIPYMAPEQIQGYPQPASDQYALGIIAYEWLTGMLPFDGSTPEIIVKHLQTPPPSMRAKVPALPPLAEQAIFMALRKDPKTRFANIQAFANALEQISLQSASTVYPPVVQPTLPAKALFVPTIPITPPIPRLPTRRVGTLISSHPGSYQYNAWSLDGKYIASVRGYSVEIWDASNGKNVSAYGHNDIVSYVAWAPDGKWLASASNDKTVQIHVPANGKLEFTYTGHFGPATHLAWAPDSRLIASTANKNEVHIWDMLSGYTISTSRDALFASWSPNDAYLAIASKDDIMLFDTNALTTGAKSGMHTSANVIQKLIWSPTSSLLASYGYNVQSKQHQIQIWDPIHSRTAFNCEGTGIAWSSDGGLFATWGTSKPEVKIWDTSTGKKIFTYSGHVSSVKAVVWSPNGRRIASGGSDGTVQLWDATSGSFVYIYRGHAGTVSDISYSPDGACIASCAVQRENSSIIQVWAAD